MDTGDITSKILETYTGSTAFGILAILIMFFTLGLSLKLTPKSKISVVFEYAYEKMYGFFEEILEEGFSEFAKTYVVVLFFVIFFSNLVGILLEFIFPIFGVSENGVFHLEHYISVPSGDINFNLALAVASMWVLLYIQFQGMGFKKFAYDYFPIFGKWYISVERGTKSRLVYYALFLFAKVFDIIISMFLAFLEIVGLLAKIVSLSFRLFGNMTSGTVLLGMLVVGTSQ